MSRRPPVLFIRRALVDDGNRLAPGGELGHLLDPRRWADASSSAPSPAACTAVWPSACSRPSSPAIDAVRDEPCWVAPALFGCALLGLAIALAS